eukprot:gene5726-11573_t
MGCAFSLCGGGENFDNAVHEPNQGDTSKKPEKEIINQSHDLTSIVPAYHVDKFGNKISDANGGRVWSEKYYAARDEADKYAKLRGESFDKSKKAYDDDRKKDAKDLSDEGKKYGHLMEEANKRAVDEILRPQKLDTSDRIDLHGLLVAEAVEATKNFVNHAKGNHKVLIVITGAGHHSDPKKGAVIKPAIINLCKQEGWKLEADKNNEGSFHLYPNEASATN